MWTLTRSIGGLDDLGDRPPSRPRPQDDPRLPERRTHGRGAGAGGRGPVRPVRGLLPRPAGRGPASVGRDVASTSSVCSGSSSRIDVDPPAPRAELRPDCEACSAAKGRRSRSSSTRPVRRPSGTGSISRTRPPRGGGGRPRRCSSARSRTPAEWRGRLAESKDQPHMIDALDRGRRARSAGLTRVWRFDRMATVCHPATGRLTASFAGVAKHYGVSVAICPPRHGNRKGVVEKANHTAAQRWWRTLPDDITIEAAQASLDAFCVRVGDARRRVIDGTTRQRRCARRTRTADAPAGTVPRRRSPSNAR